ncbi:conserved hypothetical protein [uncultured spirochete]|uniref:HNH nuclease domain-containing protein n=1 Tax=uncultured spirochete TaxID=156406 RepID=A0A3P3XQY1_9SPIR|nr:conserved hypothetical protein [uncultured spirochete]
MSVTDKTRKLIWVKTGNRCAICRQKLTIDETSKDSDSVVGDECHIVSESENGPRFDKSYPEERIDSEENLIVLCKTHHKMIDDQVDTYTTEVLRAIKKNHEKWVETKLSQNGEIKPVRIVRHKNKIPKKLSRVTDGQELFNIASSYLSYYHDFPDNLSTEEAELIGSFLQNVTDWADLSDAIEPIDKVRAVKSISDNLDRLQDYGFLVFVAVEEQEIEGGIGPSSIWNALHLTIVQDDDPRIQK